jgi:hypothetical protein
VEHSTIAPAVLLLAFISGVVLFAWALWPRRKRAPKPKPRAGRIIVIMKRKVYMVDGEEIDLNDPRFWRFP